METLVFNSSESFLVWSKRVVKFKYSKYDRAPVGEQRWNYADGYSATTNHGINRGTLLSNLGYIVRIAEGKIEGKSDKTLIDDIDARGGVTLTIDWGD